MPSGEMSSEECFLIPSALLMMAFKQKLNEGMLGMPRKSSNVRLISDSEANDSNARTWVASGGGTVKSIYFFI